MLKIVTCYLNVSFIAIKFPEGSAVQTNCSCLVSDFVVATFKINVQQQFS